MTYLALTLAQQQFFTFVPVNFSLADTYLLVATPFASIRDTDEGAVHLFAKAYLILPLKQIIKAKNGHNSKRQWL